MLLLLLTKILSEPRKIQGSENYVEEKMGTSKFSVSGIIFLDTHPPIVTPFVTFFVNPSPLVLSDVLFVP